jgi:hypothetical protein
MFMMKNNKYSLTDDIFDENNHISIFIGLIDLEVDTRKKEMIKNYQLSIVLLDSDEDKLKYLNKRLKKVNSAISKYKGVTATYLREFLENYSKRENFFFAESEFIFDFISEVFDLEKFSFLEKDTSYSLKDLFNKTKEDYSLMEKFTDGYSLINEFVTIKVLIKEYKSDEPIINDNKTNVKTVNFEDEFYITKGNEKVLILEKLGVLDFLKDKNPFNTSINSLANAISLITGEKQDTIQSYINPIYNDSVSQKNNPLNSKKLVQRVDGKLGALGFETSK